MIKQDIFRILDPRYLWHRAWFLRSVAKIPWDQMRLWPDHRRPGRSPLAESTCRIHGKKGQQWEHLRPYPLAFHLSLSAFKALQAVGIDSFTDSALNQARITVRSYINRKLPNRFGRKSFMEILNLLDDLDEL